MESSATIRGALAQTGAALKAAGIESPTLDASLLLSHILNTGRTSLAAMGGDPLSGPAFTSLRALTERRINGECIAYILGKKEFRCLEFLVNPSVLVPRPDTETLVEAAIAISDGQLATDTVRVLDLCTGSGAVAISLKNERPALDVWAADISGEALQTAKKNAALLLPALPIKFLQGDLYDALPAPHSPLPTPHSPPPTPHFNLIVCNPPYIPTCEIEGLPAEVRSEPRLALDGGQDGLQIIKRVIEGAVGRLIKGGALLMEADPRQMGKIAILLEKRGFNNIKLYKDLSGKERVIGGICEKI